MKLNNQLPVFFLFLIGQFAFFNSFAQSDKRHRCGTQFVIEQQYKKNPNLKKIVAEERARLTAAALQQNALIKARTNSTLTVAVVVHVVLPDPTIVSDAQIQSQLDALNTDYAGLNGDSNRIPTAFKPFFGKGRIRFCLAKRTPSGEATNGIIRKTSSTQSNAGVGDPIKYTAQGGSDAWDPTQYLNIWVGDDQTSSFLGYSFTPSLPLSVVPLVERGFVNQYQCFGKGGTTQAPYNLGRTAVHEIGHYFNLEHIWGPTNCDGSDVCTDDDGIGDTPKQEGCNYGVPVGVLTDNCTTTAPGIMWMNYMDYVDDRAMVMYTPQQYARMEANFLNVIWMQNLANSNGCTPPQSIERDVRLVSLNNTITGINTSFLYTCSNNFQPNITIRNQGSAVVNAMRIEVKINGGTPVVTNWSGTLNAGSDITINLNPITLNNGTNNNLLIEITQVNGQSDQNTINNAYSAPGIIYPLVLTLPLTEGFEQANFPPNNWRLLNPDNNFTWQRTTDAAKTGTASMVFDNFNSEENDMIDWMISPIIPAKGRDSVFLTFQIAAATYLKPSTITELADSLEIMVSSNCGSGFLSRYKKGGLSLVTTGDIAVQTAFIPTSSQWRKDSVFIGFYDNTGPDQIQIAFKHTTNWENNIYIDDISIFNRVRNTNTGINDLYNTVLSTISLYPNPVNAQLTVDQLNAGKNMPYRIVNVFGQQVMSGILQNQKSVIDLSRLSSGIYFFHVKEGAVKLIKN